MRRVTPIVLCLTGLAWVTVGEAQASPTNAGELQNPLETGASCEGCHLFANPADRADEALHAPAAFLGSMMGNSARDPVFWAGLALAHQDEPTETELCVRCHAPRAYLDGRGDVLELDELTAAEREGITCDLCHRMIDDGETPPGNAQWTIDDVVDATTNQVPKRGPWSYEAADMHNHPTSDDNALHQSSDFCGTCHDVTTVRERVDDEGNGLGFAFNEQRTYSEWVNSDFSDAASAEFQSCQGCHMPAVSDVAGCNVFLDQNMLQPTGGRLHNFVGANRFMMQLIADQQAEMILPEVPDALFDNAIEQLDAFLPTAATVEVTFPTTVDLTQGISDWAVRVTNETGHKLPSGYSEGRVMFLEVTATYDGELIYSSGLWDQDSGEIQDDAQARRYEGVADEFATGQTNHLLLNDHWVVDNRLPPKGLRLDPQTDPVGTRYSPQNGIWPHWDDVVYNFAATPVTEHSPTTPAQIDLRVRLLYVINTAEYIDELADANVTNASGEDLAAMFAARGGATPSVLFDETVTVPLEGLDAQPPAETGETTSTEVSSTTSDADEAGGSGGCDCRTDTGGPGPWGGLAFVALLGWRRRGRRPNA